MFESEKREDRVIVALDCDADKAISIAYQLRGRAKWVKIGMTLYYAYGTDLIKMLKARGYNVFLDLKFHDIPHQVEGAARSAAATGADMITMQTVGGVPMMQAALKGAIQGAAEIGSDVPVTLGITVLTSMNEEILKQVGVVRPMREQVLELAGLTQLAGISGVVASPLEAADLRAKLGEDAYIVCPGVRPSWAATGDQSRIATPKAAFDAGASHIVIGRPITDAEDPIAAYERIIEEL
jgi:orotidine-5'-phosphate decarboxylase